MADEIATLLKYANVQMAAEALFGVSSSTSPGAVVGPTSIDVGWLTTGNNRASQFTGVAATQFAQEWSIVEHKSNTTIGFSGTLFKNNQTGEMVLSFRSTEFIDDAARDNQATNSMEISKFGWAFGQIDDMQQWFASLQASGKLDPGAPITVTGYSLGGHLATAFSLLHKNDLTAFGAPLISTTYTFNGAGVGGYSSGTLAQVIDTFHAIRGADNAALFTSNAARDIYMARRSLLNGSATMEARGDVLRQITLAKLALPSDPLANATASAELDMLYEAIGRGSVVLQEALRVNGGISSGSSTPSAGKVAPGLIEATRVDYQLAVLVAARQTYGWRTGLDELAQDAATGQRWPAVGLSNVYDVYGDTKPSAVANSQIHYGQATPVYIEDQPTYRGNTFLTAGLASLRYLDLKLLSDGFSNNDFGDTHSLVLLVDSLSVQAAMAKLDPTLSKQRVDAIFKNAGYFSKSEFPLGSQGTAEGDTLEGVVNALAALFGVTGSPLKGDPNGNTWAEVKDANGYNGREALHATLAAIQRAPAYTNLLGKVIFSPIEETAAANLAQQAKARVDFQTVAALQTLAPFVVDPAGAEAAAEVATHLWQSGTWSQQYAAWQNDIELLQAGKEPETFTESYLTDRALLLQSLLKRNGQNIGFTGAIIDATLAPTDRSIDFRYYEPGGTQQTSLLLRNHQNTGVIGIPRQLIAFDSDAARTLIGTDETKFGDHLYGAGGNDTINGLAGDDYIEGGVGNDLLDGGDGHDQLLSGAGDDTLSGGKNHDLLVGGAGEDTYRFSGSFGLDIIRDSDGKGSIYDQLTGAPLTGGKKLAANVWISDDKQTTYTVIDGNLIVRAAYGRGFITVQHWQPGDLGITLSDEQVPPVTPVSPFTGDFVKKQNEQGTEYLLGADGNYVAAGVEANALDLITGSTGADLIQGLGGDDALLGRAGDDLVVGGEGNDILMGGLGADDIRGGAGRDLIYGSSNGWLRYDKDLHYLWTQPQPIYDFVLGKGFNWTWFSSGIDADGFHIGTLTDSSVGREPQPGDSGNIIDGDAGEDVIYSGSGNDIVHGGQDGDQVWGSAGDDVLFGDAGNDRIFGDGPTTPGTIHSTPVDQHGSDIIVGGDGDDLLIGQGGNDVLYGGFDNDVLYGDDRSDANLNGEDYLDGGVGNDVLRGGAGDDILVGGAGDDTLAGGAGRDVYIFNRGDGIDVVDDTKTDNNVLRLGAGVNRDVIKLRLGSLLLDLGGGDQIHIEGFDQNDALNSSAISSFEFSDGSVLSVAELMQRGFDIDGTEGDDVLWGTNLDDRIRGLGGNDVLRAQSGVNLLDGGDGDDQLMAGGGEDTLIGGSGRNSYFLHEQGTLTLVQASGEEDTIVLAAGVKLIDVIGGSADAQGLTLTLVNGQQLLVQGQAKYQFAEDTYSQAEVVAFISSLTGASGTGTDGNDILHGQATDDYLFAGEGDDVVVGAAGDDRLFGESGQDTIAGSAGADSIAGGGGNDTLYGDGGSDKLWGQAGDDALHGGAGGDELTGGEGNDLLVGGVGNDVLIAGGSGTKTYLFNLGDGRDLVLSAPGTRHVKFGAGISASDIKLYTSPAGVSPSYVRLEYSAQDSVVIQLGAGNGPLQYEFANGALMTHAALTSLVSKGVSTTYTRIGSEGADQLVAGSRPSEIVGAGGNDTLYGSAFDDVLRGGSGNDELLADSGNDLLEGGSGNDGLAGGWGSDTYVYARGDGNDVIRDGAVGGDVNVLRFADLSAVDVIYSREASGSLLIKVKDSNGSIEIPDWYTGASPRLQQIVYADGSSHDLATLEDLEQAPIVGTTGSDALKGTVYADVLAALAGDDSLDGGRGDDLLLGGEGADTYSMYRGMGVDTIDEAAVSTNVLKLGTGLSFQELVDQRQGNDLYLHFSAAADGVVLKDFFVDGGDWQVKLESGQQRALDDVMAENHARPRAEAVEQLRHEWMVGAKTSLLEMYVYDARRYQAEQVGPFELRVDYDNTYAVVRGFAETSQVSDAAYIERSSWVSQETGSSWTETYTALLPVDRFQQTTVGGSNPYLEIYDYSRLDALGNPTHTLLGLLDGGYADRAQLPRDGVVLIPESASIPTSGYGMVKVKLFADLDSSEVFEDITAGPSNNFIYTYGAGTVDAGGGDDVVYAESMGRAWGHPGLFIDAGVGDDVVAGSQSDDLILAGVGNDYLMGDMGHDTYHLSAVDVGTKIIDEASTSSLRVPHPNGFWTTGGMDKIGTDTVRFGPGIEAASIRVERGAYISPYAVNWGFHGGQWGYAPDLTVYETLDISWGTDAVARVLVPTVDNLNSEDGGLGIEFFEFADGTRLTTSEFLAMVGGQDSNTAPVVSQPLLAQGAIEDAAWSFTVPANTFMDPDAGDSLAYGACLANGVALPAWLNFDAVTRTFSGTPGNADVGTLTLQVTATDTQGNTAGSNFTLTVENSNDAPILATPIADQLVLEDQPWQLALPQGMVDDVDMGDTLTYAATLVDGAALPSWLTFDAQARSFSGTPSNAQVGDLTLRVTATDGSGAVAQTAFTLSVLNVNDAPVVVLPIAGHQALEDEAWSFTVPGAAFVDVDVGDALQLSATLADGPPLPAWLQFDAATRTFSALPGNEQVGTLRLQVTAADFAGASAAQTFELTVANVNDAPVSALPVADQVATEDQPWAFQVPCGTFADVDANDALRLSASLADGSALPGWLQFDANTGTFSGTSLNEHVGSLRLRVTAVDMAGASAGQEFALSALNVNDAPVAAQPVIAQAAAEDQAWSWTVPDGTFIDVDTGDTLQLGASLADGSALPSWLHFDAATRTFSGTPSNDEVGTLSLRLTATDVAGTSASVTFALDVVNTNDAPIATGPLPDSSVRAGTAYRYEVPRSRFSDVDRGDTLTFQAWLADGSALPAWLHFDAATLAFSGTPQNSDANVLALQVVATDAAGAAASLDVMLTVGAVLTGGSGKDALVGSVGGDLLNGGAGSDSMAGGLGNDDYVVDAGGDSVAERAGEGFDTVTASVTHTLAANVEKLVLAGAVNGTGNSQDNWLVGSAGDNKLAGGAGNDILGGGGGADQLDGGTGNDTYVFDRGDGLDTVTENDATAGNADVLAFGPDIGAEQLWFRKDGVHLEVSVIGTADTLTLRHWFKGSAYHVEALQTSDGKTLLDSQVQSLVDAMAAFSPPAAGQTTLPANYQQALGGVIAANWH